jgi:hypothetical protein
MQWVKRTFAVRFNRRTKRTGHVWGDRYWSRVLEGEPPEWAAEVDREAVEVAAETGVISFGTCPPDGVSPLTTETPAETGFSPVYKGELGMDHASIINFLSNEDTPTFRRGSVIS